MLDSYSINRMGIHIFYTMHLLAPIIYSIYNGGKIEKKV